MILRRRKSNRQFNAREALLVDDEVDVNVDSTAQHSVDERTNDGVEPLVCYVQYRESVGGRSEAKAKGECSGAGRSRVLYYESGNNCHRSS